MAGLFDKQAETYLDARPTYPADWYSMLADRTSSHSLAWDVGTGNGQAAIGWSGIQVMSKYGWCRFDSDGRRGFLRLFHTFRRMEVGFPRIGKPRGLRRSTSLSLPQRLVAEHYKLVIGTDVSEAQLKLAKPHPRVRYLHTPLSLPDNELIKLIGGEKCVDLVTVAQAVHWFDLPRFYSIVSRVLRKADGVLAVWGYNDFAITPEIDAALKRFHQTTIPYWNENVKYVFDCYRTLPFPFDSIGLGSEGSPLTLDIPKELSFEELLGMLKSWSAVVTARERGVELLDENVVAELERVWGGSKLVRRVVYKGFMLAGKVRP